MQKNNKLNIKKFIKTHKKTIILVFTIVITINVILVSFVGFFYYKAVSESDKLMEKTINELQNQYN